MRYKSITKCSIDKAFRWSEKHWERYNQYLVIHFSEYRHEKNGPYLEKEFIFRGFVLLDNFKKKRGFDYIESNQLINGKRYIYPKKYTSGVYAKNWTKYSYSYTMQEYVGILDYTKVSIYRP